jgi:maltooligosyltrehalose trehalohydrolase
MLKPRQIAQGTIGAQVAPFGVNYRAWAPDAREVDVRVESAGGGRTVGLNRDDEGYWSATDFGGRAGDRYRFALDDGPLLPDVASRFQPMGIDGPSECIDPASYDWECPSWQRPGWRGQTTYEIHVGTMTREGTFLSAISKLGEIRDLGAEAIEIMPVADFAGKRNWGYDGVSLFAPARCYGRPDELRALVDAAHRRGLAVILDVVYNHVGPQGDYFASYCSDYFRNEKETPWGRGFNLDGSRSGPVREFLKANVAYWLDEFRIDGLRLDATHAILDASPDHFIHEVADLAHSRGAFLVAEDERNTTGILRTADGGGFGLDAAWADDFHHQVRVAVTGTRASYFSAYEGKPADIASTVENGWTYRGQAFSPWNGRPRGEPCAFLPSESFVYCIENHDQVGNRAFGERLEHLIDPSRFRAASMLLCLNPHAILIFMGQEWAASAPFLFFCDHGGELGRNISKGRQSELGGNGAEYGPHAPDPEGPETFEKSKLAWDERSHVGHRESLLLYTACLKERRLLASSGAFLRGSWEATSEGPLVAIRYGHSDTEKLLLVNLNDRSLFPESLPDSLKAPAGRSWNVVLDSEAPEFGGSAVANTENWILHGPGALWLQTRGKDSNAAH